MSVKALQIESKKQRSKNIAWREEKMDRMTGHNIPSFEIFLSRIGEEPKGYFTLISLLFETAIMWKACVYFSRKARS